MPLYDYKCTKCEHVFEIQQRITEEPLKICPKCKGPVRRLISPAGIVFKGSGFHVTDYCRKPKAESKKQNTEKEAKETKSSAAAASPTKSK